MLKKYIIVFLISMVPLIELRGAIPYAVGFGLPLVPSLILAVIGNMLPVPFIIVYIRRIFAWLRLHWKRLDGLITRLEKRAEGKGEAVEKYGTWGLLILVAIPLPGTGAWTGALVAALLNLKLRKAVPVIFVGVCIAAIIMMALTIGFTHFF